jgi:hypothetical protein
VGYDLDYRRDTAQLHVEVKGIQGASLTFSFTALEWARALDDPDFLVIAVTGVLCRGRSTGQPGSNRPRRGRHKSRRVEKVSQPDVLHVHVADSSGAHSGSSVGFVAHVSFAIGEDEGLGQGNLPVRGLLYGGVQRQQHPLDF